MCKHLSSIRDRLTELPRTLAALQAKWRASSEDLTQILQNIKSAVEQSTQDYVQTEKQATSRFQ